VALLIVFEGVIINSFDLVRVGLSVCQGLIRSLSRVGLVLFVCRVLSVADVYCCLLTTKIQ
jgi:hypothetical protein